MKIFAGLSFALLPFFAFAQQPTEIMVVGSDHLAQVYKEGNPNTDVLTTAKQQEVQAFANAVAAYRPDAIMVEALPEEQHKTDSLYALYLSGRLDLKSLPDGRSEIYNLAFYIGKKQGVKQIICVNAPGGTSQGLLNNGTNIDLYNKETAELREMVKAKYAALANGALSFKDYLAFLNTPEAYNKIYHLRYFAPLRVTNGTFNDPNHTVDSTTVDSRYIGAELTTLFKERDYKIYSNIVACQMAQKPKRMLLVIGVAHIGSLRSILRDDAEFKIVDTDGFVK